MYARTAYEYSTLGMSSWCVYELVVHVLGEISHLDGGWSAKQP